MWRAGGILPLFFTFSAKDATNTWLHIIAPLVAQPAHTIEGRLHTGHCQLLCQKTITFSCYVLKKKKTKILMLIYEFQVNEFLQKRPVMENLYSYRLRSEACLYMTCQFIFGLKNMLVALVQKQLLVVMMCATGSVFVIFYT